MSRHSHQPEMRRGIGRFAFSILGGLVLASQLVLPSTTFAISARPASSADPPASQSLALSEVAVVRLVFSYKATPASNGTTAGNPVLCTSLGVLVNSVPASTLSTSNNWVLTDGSLLNTTPSPCAQAGAGSQGNTSISYGLSTITVYANTAYAGTSSPQALLGTYTASPVSGFLCTATPCTNGAFFFSFHTDHLQPVLNIATANTTQQFGVALTSQVSPTARPPVPLSSIEAALAFLNPTAVSPGATSTQNEVGMPIINAIGQMVAMNLQGNVKFTSEEYNVIVAQRSIFALAPANPLQVNWENGIAAYYSLHYQDAITDFQTVESLNPNFTAAKTFEQQAIALSHSQSNQVRGNTGPTTESTSVFGIPRSTVLIVGFAAGILLLIVVLIFVSTWARRRHELARFKAEQAEAQRNAEKEIFQQQIAQQQNTSVEKTKRESLLQDNASSRQKISTINPPLPTNQLCSNCGQAMPAGAIYCANCRYLLSPIVGDAPSALEFPGIGKTLPLSVTTSQPHLAPVKEVVLDDLAIQEALNRLWERAEL